MRTWWADTWLVMRRAMREGSAARSWRIVTGLLALVGLAVVVVPSLLGDDADPVRIGTIGEASTSVRGDVDAWAGSADIEVSWVTLDVEASPEEQVRQGEVDVALAPDATQIVTRSGLDPAVPTLLAQAVVGQETAALLADFGLSAEQVTALQQVQAPEQVEVGPARDPGRAFVGFMVGVALYLALLVVGIGVANAVALEKTNRIAEVLLTMLRPSQLLVGTVLGVATLGLVQLAAFALPAGVGIAVNDLLPDAGAALVDVALAITWFVLGLLLYTFAFAALAALVEKVSEVNSVTTPVSMVLVASYVVAVTAGAGAPQGAVATITSILPPTAPLVMPVRWASGLVPVWQLVLAMVLTVLASVAVAWLASRVYARGLVGTGRRQSLREVMRVG
jgi:ABC-2 type transport system permease protein